MIYGIKRSKFIYFQPWIMAFRDTNRLIQTETFLSELHGNESPDGDFIPKFWKRDDLNLLTMAYTQKLYNIEKESHFVNKHSIKTMEWVLGEFFVAQNFVSLL